NLPRFDARGVLLAVDEVGVALPRRDRDERASDADQSHWHDDQQSPAHQPSVASHDNAPARTWSERARSLVGRAMAYGFWALPGLQSVDGSFDGFPGGPVWMWFLSPQPMPGLY